MADQRFRFAKVVFDYLTSNSIEYSTNADIILDVSDYSNLTLLQKTTITSLCAAHGLEPE